MDYLEIIKVEPGKEFSKFILKVNHGDDELLFGVEHPYVPLAVKYFTCYVENIVCDIKAYAVGDKYRNSFSSHTVYDDQNDRIIADIKRVIRPEVQAIKEFYRQHRH